MAEELAERGGFSLICGRYEGVDQRVADHLCDGELSVGEYVLAGGEAAALVVVEATARLVPGVMGNAASGEQESFADGLLEYPQYTRPAEFRGWAVPEVLRAGDHARIARWFRNWPPFFALQNWQTHLPTILFPIQILIQIQRQLYLYFHQ
jgi:tRNA (guanine37-N1)-methyltransferase